MFNVCNLILFHIGPIIKISNLYSVNSKTLLQGLEIQDF